MGIILRRRMQWLKRKKKRNVAPPVKEPIPVEGPIPVDEPTSTPTPSPSPPPVPPPSPPPVRNRQRRKSTSDIGTDPGKISVVVPTWGQSTVLLKRMLYTLVNQTQPPLEVIIVDGGPSESHNVQALASGIVRVIKAHIPQFNLSRLFNIGIRRARGEYIMTTGNDRLLSKNFLEVASRSVSHRGMLGGTWGMLRKNANLSGDIFDRWAAICSCVIPDSTGKVNPGSFQIASKDWFCKVRGFDETMPFAYVDSDITGRAVRSGLFRPGYSYKEAQLLHQWHKPSPLVASLGVTLAEFREKGGIVRNPDEWGTLPEGSPLGVSFIFTWKRRDPRYLRCTLHSLSNQTVPPVEIIVTDQEPDGDPTTLAVCNEYPLCRYIHAPHEAFNLSWGFNVGIKRTIGDFVITTGAEFVFAKNYVETIQPLLAPGIWLDSENTPLIRRATMEMLDHPDPSTDLYWGQPFTKFPAGLHVAGFFGATREWLEKAHGWNEELPFACSDADIWRRAEMDGLKKVFVGHDKTQIFHLWHPQSNYLDLADEYFKVYEASPIVCNLNGWGEIKEMLK